MAAARADCEVVETKKPQLGHFLDGCKPHPVAILACDNPEAIVLDLMQPQVPGGNLSVFVGRHGAMNPAGRVRCNMRP
jgi:hypothetical protein